MSPSVRTPLFFAIMAAALLAVGVFQSWTLALAILNLSLVSAIMALGVNMQWGYAGLFNVGVMGFAALGGVGAVLVSMPPVPGAWAAGSWDLAFAALAVLATIGAALLVTRLVPKGRRTLPIILVLVIGYFAIRYFGDRATEAVEGYEAASLGYLGGLGLPVLLGWVVGALFAAGAAWLIGKVALGLRSDYLAIATLGISEIIIAIIKNEAWLTRGVKNVTGLPRPAPYEIELQQDPGFVDFATGLGLPATTASSLAVALVYTALFSLVLIALLALSERALNSPWGRMMRAIRDNRDAAAAMGKDVTRRHLQIFVIGSAVVGLGGAMLVTLDGQFTPGSYQPLRFTFLIWVMVILGGSGNNMGSVLGAFVIWFVWVQAEPAGLWLMDTITAGMAQGDALRAHLLDSAPHLRLFLMGVILLVVLRFSPRGLLPEKTGGVPRKA
ncbi:branched-chain amino acid ABC transporter permease [Salinarimonas ramus]|uniref:Branched-chain amino acid ABC transporter permease n=1 Tax=Salinarimonas ramus TaxID=690164 RepID=A0A917QB44_9HYPH|nr:branched-chain amino acid ABC transporter permease [Salinarimonas ramus]GGK40645.1 branched-chain amino acid ABC transporter permease [Salinarimonas ramus]